MKNKTTQIIEAFGGTKSVTEILGLTKGRIYQFQNWDQIPKHWLMVLILMRPDLNWSRLGQKKLAEATLRLKADLQSDLGSVSATPAQVGKKRNTPGTR